jgi:hypothetical protein
VLRQVRLHQLGEGQRSREPPLAPLPLQLTLQRLRRFLLGDKAATLHPLRVTAAIR